jgi:hypothetical protein
MLYSDSRLPLGSAGVVGTIVPSLPALNSAPLSPSLQSFAAPLSPTLSPSFGSRNGSTLFASTSLHTTSTVDSVLSPGRRSSLSPHHVSRAEGDGSLFFGELPHDSGNSDTGVPDREVEGSEWGEGDAWSEVGTMSQSGAVPEWKVPDAAAVEWLEGIGGSVEIAKNRVRALRRVEDSLGCGNVEGHSPASA